MNKQDKLAMLMLLSAIESWSFSVQTRMPEYLHDRIDATIDVLKEEILENGKQRETTGP